MNSFPRPIRPRGRPQPVRPDPTHPSDGAAPVGLPGPRPNFYGTLLALGGIGLTAFTMTGDTPSGLARWAAIGVGASIAASVAMDAKAGIRNLPRADLFAILAYYFLTLFEFLFPQPTFDTMIAVRSTWEGLLVCLVGFAGLFAGRHLLRAKRQPFEQVLTHEIPPGWLVVLFWASFFIGYLHMLLAVNFNVFELLDAFVGPRFTQPWSRGKLGDWKALVFELGMFIQLVPPLAGIILVRRNRYSPVQVLLVASALAFTLFYGFSSGTRNLFASYLVTFLIGYALALAPGRKRELIAVTVASALAMCFAAYAMLQFRTVGLKNYLTGGYAQPESREVTFYVDYNLANICLLVDVFPHRRDYLGWEIPYQALIRPIPRALWHGKPEGLSYSIEEALGMEGVTISATFAGEAYMSGGHVAVLLIALLFGAITGWWSYLASPKNSELGILIYASGFFATVISMRSLLVFTTALMPTVAAVVIGTFVVRKLVAQAQRFLYQRALVRGRPGPPRRSPYGAPRP